MRTRPAAFGSSLSTVRRRKPTAVAHVSGLVLAIGGAGMLLSAVVDIAAGGPDTLALLISGSAVGLPGLVVWRRTRVQARLPNTSIFAAVLTSWVVLSIAGTVPYLLSGTIANLDDALFESVSGFTTTGATILSPIEGLGPGILFFRSMTQWFGGMGVIVLAVAVLPFLGVGGLGLLQAEAPGPTSERLVPRVRETARRLWILYLGFTVVVALAYVGGGMSPYDAVAHSFTTVSTGGFSPYDASIANFGSPIIEWSAIVAMLIAGGNFALYWRTLRGHDPAAFFRSREAIAYLIAVAGMSGVAVVWNVARDGLTHDVVRGSVFSVVSVASTTGYTTDDFGTWAPPLLLLLLFAMGLGGMTGSTAGGFKMFRLLTVLGYAKRQVAKQLHPRLVGVVRIGKDPVPDEIVDRVVGFFGLFMAIGAVATFVVAVFGSDVVTSISAAAASIGNVGPGLADVGPSAVTYLAVARPARFVLVIVMLLGRLEIFAVLLGIVAVARWLDDRASKTPLRRLLRRRVGR